MTYQKHLILPSNTVGNDYIVGDIHGHYSNLITLLEHIQFDKSVDRLFSVGDIIDRGPNSIKLIELINEPWFFMTLGNHELMMIQSIIHNVQSYTDCWLNNGGDWSTLVPKNKLTKLAHLLSKQPLMISVIDETNRFNICHAELISVDHYNEIIPISDSFIDNWEFTTRNEDDMLWGINIINMHFDKTSKKYHSIKTNIHNKLSKTFVGHSISKTYEPIQLQSHVYLDTGCSMQSKNFSTSSKFKLTIVSPTNNTVYQLTSKTKQFITYPLSDITIL